MESDNLYRVQEEDLPRLQKLLTVCFAQDPLYHTLIPDDDTRETDAFRSRDLLIERR